MVSELAGIAKAADYSVGIGIPGSISPVTGKVQNANSTWINGRHFLADVETALKREVRMANDANCLAVSEAYDGAGQQAASVFGVILGTGCGGGLVVNGNVITGRHGIAGEWGHKPASVGHGRQNYPVLHAGAVATAASRPGCQEQRCPTIITPGTVSTCRQKKIALNANAGDGPAIATLNRHLDRCGRGVAHVINIFDPGNHRIGRWPVGTERTSWSDYRQRLRPTFLQMRSIFV